MRSRRLATAAKQHYRRRSTTVRLYSLLPSELSAKFELGQNAHLSKLKHYDDLNAAHRITGSPYPEYLCVLHNTNHNDALFAINELRCIDDEKKRRCTYTLYLKDTHCFPLRDAHARTHTRARARATRTRGKGTATRGVTDVEKPFNKFQPGKVCASRAKNRGHCGS